MVFRCPQCGRICLLFEFFQEHQLLHWEMRNTEIGDSKQAQVVHPIVESHSQVNAQNKIGVQYPIVESDSQVNFRKGTGVQHLIGIQNVVGAQYSIVESHSQVNVKNEVVKFEEMPNEVDTYSQVEKQKVVVCNKVESHNVTGTYFLQNSESSQKLDSHFEENFSTDNLRQENSAAINANPLQAIPVEIDQNNPLLTNQGDIMVVDITGKNSPEVVSDDPTVTNQADIRMVDIREDSLGAISDDPDNPLDIDSLNDGTTTRIEDDPLSITATGASVEEPNVGNVEVVNDILVITHEKNPVEKISYCEYCGNYFEDSKVLKHLFTHSISQKCSDCELTYSNVGEFEVHRIYHKLKVQRTFSKCSKCRGKFISPKILVQHCDHCHDKDSPLECEKCSETFDDSASFQNHVASHVGKYLNVCNTCGLIFEDLEIFEEHMDRHKKGIFTGETFQCFKCAIVFMEKFKMLMHFHIAHKGQKPHYCKMCDEIYYCLEKYNAHSCLRAQNKRIK